MNIHSKCMDMDCNEIYQELERVKYEVEQIHQKCKMSLVPELTDTILIKEIQRLRYMEGELTRRLMGLR